MKRRINSFIRWVLRVDLYPDPVVKNYIRRNREVLEQQQERCSA
jgi:hypothetical protein